MSFWLTDPELFLYAKGIGPDDVHLWRCKKPESSSSSSSLVVPMKSDDFDYVSKVENHVELIGDMFDWDELDYKRLVKYIYEKHLLVNSQGFVIAEVLHEADKDGNKKIDDANEEEDVPGVNYIRSLDVLPLKSYIPKLRERPIPLRTVKYLGDVNGKAALMEGNSQVTMLTAKVENLEAENKTLDDKLTKSTARVENLEAENKTLDDKVTKLTTDLVTQMNALTTLQTNLNSVWMTNLTNSEWVGVEGLSFLGYDIAIIGSLGTFTTDDSSTNVRARYWYKVKIVGGSVDDYNFYKVVSLEDLIPNKEMARFSSRNWVSIKSKGKAYVLRSM